MTMVKAFSLKFVILYAAAATSPIFCLSNQKCSFKVPSNPDHTRQWQCKRRIARDTGNIMQSSGDSNPNSIIGHHQRYNSPFNHPLNAHKTPTKLKQTKVFFQSEKKRVTFVNPIILGILRTGTTHPTTMQPIPSPRPTCPPITMAPAVCPQTWSCRAQETCPAFVEKRNNWLGLRLKAKGSAEYCRELKELQGLVCDKKKKHVCCKDQL